MRTRLLAVLGVFAALSLACSAATRYRVLSTLFDGVPPPPGQAADHPTNAAAGTAAPAPRPVDTDHGPYGAKLCGACHQAGTNVLVASGDQLCGRCHALTLTKRYIHGPLAAGGCRACHEPHTSRFRYLLVAESRTFCLRCHDRNGLSAIPEHSGREAECTACHDAHQSDRRYLLR